MLGCRALNGLRDVLLGPIGGHLAGLGIEAFQQVGGVMPGFTLDLLDEELLGFVGSKAGDAFQLVLLLGDQAVVFLSRSLGDLLALRHGLFARAQLFVQTLGRRLTLSQRPFPAVKRLLDRQRLLAIVPGLFFGLGRDVVGLFLGREQRFFLSGLGVAFGVLDEAGGALFSATNRVGGDSLAAGEPDGEDDARRHQGHQHNDQVPVYRQHGETPRISKLK